MCLIIGKSHITLKFTWISARSKSKNSIEKIMRDWGLWPWNREGKTISYKAENKRAIKNNEKNSEI